MVTSLAWLLCCTADAPAQRLPATSPAHAQYELVQFELPPAAGKTFRRMFITKVVGPEHRAAGAVLIERAPQSYQWVLTRWDSPARPVVLEMQPSGWTSGSLSINSGGIVVGAVASGAQGDPLMPARWDKDASRHALALPPNYPPGPKAVDVNTLGDIVGSGTSGPAADEYGPGIIRWPASGAPVVLPMPARAKGCQASAINDAGQIVGSALIQPGDGPVQSGTPEARAVMWNAKGQPRMLDVPQGAQSTMALHCSQSGFVAGRGVGHSGEVMAVRWDSRGKPQVLKMPITAGQPVREAIAYAVDDAGRCVGDVQLPDGTRRAVLWESDGAHHFLDDLMDKSGKGWKLRTAKGIGKDFILAVGSDDPADRDRQVPVLLKIVPSGARSSAGGAQ
jgi:uncharacterized membrane protein